MLSATLACTDDGGSDPDAADRPSTTTVEVVATTPAGALPELTAVRVQQDDLKGLNRP